MKPQSYFLLAGACLAIAFVSQAVGAKGDATPESTLNSIGVATTFFTGAAVLGLIGAAKAM